MVTPLLRLDITRIQGSNENICAYFIVIRVCIVSSIIPKYPKNITQQYPIKYPLSRFQMVNLS